MFPLRAIIAACVALRIHPNVLTFIGVLINVAAAWHLATGRFVTAGFIMVVANIFDFIDGKVAHETGAMSKFGGFWDSVIDRFSDIALSVGLICLYSSLGRTDYVLITSLAMVFAMMTSYTRARAESLIAKCKVGFMERPERIVLFMIGAFTNRMAAVMWVICVLSIVTVADRSSYTYLELEQLPERRRRSQTLAAARSGCSGTLLLDRRARHVAVRPDGDRDPRVRLAHAARLARRPDGVRHGPIGWLLDAAVQLPTQLMPPRPSTLRTALELGSSWISASMAFTTSSRSSCSPRSSGLAREVDVVRGDLVAQHAARLAVGSAAGTMSWRANVRQRYITTSVGCCPSRHVSPPIADVRHEAAVVQMPSS